MKRASIALAAILAAALLLTALLPGPARAADACAQMKAYLAQGTGSGGGLLVVDSESGDVVCASAASTPRPLASNMKLFTTAAALAKLGPEARISTKVFASGQVTADGVLHGN